MRQIIVTVANALGQKIGLFQRPCQIVFVHFDLQHDVARLLARKIAYLADCGWRSHLLHMCHDWIYKPQLRRRLEHELIAGAPPSASGSSSGPSSRPSSPQTGQVAQ